MAVELLTCDSCGTDWTRRIVRHQPPPPPCCPDCASMPAVSATGTKELRSAMVPRATRFDPDVPLAFRSEPVRSAVERQGAAPSLCPACTHEWVADQNRLDCPNCGNPHGRVLRSSSVVTDASVAKASDFACALRDIPQLGTTRVARIMERYQTPAALADADPDDLCRIQGVGPHVAEAAIRAARQHAEQESREPGGSATLASDPFTMKAIEEVGDAKDVDSEVEMWATHLRQYRCTICARIHLDLPERRQPPLCLKCDTGKVLSAGHGVRAALRHGCRCHACLDAVARVRVWVTGRLRGYTLQEIADQVGLTRERVRQITNMVEPSKPWEAVDRVERLEREEVAAIAAAALEEVRSAQADPCPVCGGAVDGISRRRYCSTDCRHRYNVLRYHVEPDRRKMQRFRTSRWVVDHADEVPDFQLRHAKRVLAGAARWNEQRRWLIVGSEAFAVAVEAVINGWPLAELLPDLIRAQIDQYLGRTIATDWRQVFTAEVIRHEYETACKPPSKIANSYRAPLEAVYEAMDRHGIQPRAGVTQETYHEVLTAEYLWGQYVDKGRTSRDIAEEVGCYHTTVLAALRRHGI